MLDGWFALTKILKESLIFGNLEASSKQLSRPVTCKSRVGRNLSYADAVRGRLINPQSSSLRGWRCRQYGPWDVYATILGEDKEPELVIHNHQDEAECLHSTGRVTPLEVENRVGSPIRKTG